MDKKESSHATSMTMASGEWKDHVAKGLARLSVQADAGMIDCLARHSKEMLQWNKTTNLTAITDPIDVAVKHVIDSGAAVPHIPHAATVLDLGTGGGYPGIPLKILIPSIDITLVDASRKKVNFLKQVIRSLSLTKAHAIQARGEELAKESDYQNRFDVVISRAFSGLDVFVPMALPFLKDDGVIIAMKGRETEQEKFLLQTLVCTLADGRVIRAGDLDLELITYRLPYLDSERALMIIRIEK